MKLREPLTDAYQLQSSEYSEAGQVSIYRLDDVERPASFPHIRRDFYKIELLCNAQGILGYADSRVVVQEAALIFVNPLIPYSWKRTAGRETGFACLFSEEFIPPQLRTGPARQSPLFKIGVTPVLFPTQAELSWLNSLFEQLIADMQSSYVNKYDLIRHYVHVLIHESLKRVPGESAYKPRTAAMRISSLFEQLLNQQFPIASPKHSLPLRNANEFARQIGVHTNHLNKALKEITGKTTTEYITDRIIHEARALLRHSDWTIAEIGDCLGFEHPSNFNTFFKKHTGQSPSQYRRQPVVVSYVFD